MKNLFARTLVLTAVTLVSIGSFDAYASNKPWVPVVGFGVQLVKVIGTFSKVNAQGVKEDRSFDCSGLLVSPTQVISASHCFYQRNLDTLEVFDNANHKQDADKLSVKIGDVFAGFASQATQVVGKKNLGYLKADVATFNLSAPFPGSFPAHPIRLAKTLDEARDLTLSSECVSAGFGRPDSLPPVTTWYTTLGIAKRMIAHAFKVTRANESVSADGYNIATDLVLSAPRQVTHGDSGGPVVCTNASGERVLVGVNSSYADIYFEAKTSDGVGSARSYNYFVLTSEESILSE